MQKSQEPKGKHQILDDDDESQDRVTVSTESKRKEWRVEKKPKDWKKPLLIATVVGITLMLVFLVSKAFFGGSKSQSNLDMSPEDVSQNLGTSSRIPGKQEFANPLRFDEIENPKIPENTYTNTLELEWQLYGTNHLNIVIRDAKTPRYEMPLQEPYPRPRHPPLSDLSTSNFDVSIGFDPFSVIVKRKKTNEVIFQFVDRFVFSDLYMEFTIKTPTNRLYGLGERSAPLQVPAGTYTLFIIDRPGLIDPGLPGYNSNGHQSLYLMGEKSNLYHVCLLRNLHPQEIVVQPEKLLWKVVGGVLDFNIFLGETPEEAVQGYHEYAGGWTIPALWHLGSHQCKWWGYKNAHELEEVLKGYDNAKVPLDVLWSDIDYQKNAANFWFDEVNFPSQVMKDIFKNYKRRWIAVVQANVPDIRESYAWTFPNLTEILVKDGLDQSKPAYGNLYSGNVFFVDNFHPRSEDFWNKMYDRMTDLYPVSGIWLDANEITNGVHTLRNRDQAHVAVDKTRKYYNMPFYPGVWNFYDLCTIDLDAIHYGDIEEMNVRPLNSLHQSKHTYNYFKKKFTLPFVLTRGNTMGSGQFAFHFIPDVGSRWDFFRASTAQVANYNILGIPMVGSDICGMGGNTQTPAELCARWYQMGAFYPFARNHHQPTNEFFNSQEPYQFKGIYFDAILAAIHLRYSILKQMNAIFLNKPGTDRRDRRYGTIFRPLFFEFPQDSTLPPFGHKVFEEQYLLGEMLMVSPVFYEAANSVETYFPNCRWFDLRSLSEVPIRGGTRTISATLNELPPMFLRGGYILMKQETEGIKSSEDLDNNFSAYAALNDLQKSPTSITGKAEGYILSATNYTEKYIYDKCVQQDCMLKIQIEYLFRTADKFTLVTLKTITNGPAASTDGVTLKELHILGAGPEIDGMEVKSVACAECSDQLALQVSVSSNVIRFYSMNLTLKAGSFYTLIINDS